MAAKDRGRERTADEQTKSSTLRGRHTMEKWRFNEIQDDSKQKIDSDRMQDRPYERGWGAQKENNKEIQSLRPWKTKTLKTLKRREVTETERSKKKILSLSY